MRASRRDHIEPPNVLTRSARKIIREAPERPGIPPTASPPRDAYQTRAKSSSRRVQSPARRSIEATTLFSDYPQTPPRSPASRRTLRSSQRQLSQLSPRRSRRLAAAAPAPRFGALGHAADLPGLFSGILDEQPAPRRARSPAPSPVHARHDSALGDDEEETETEPLFERLGAEADAGYREAPLQHHATRSRSRSPKTLTRPSPQPIAFSRAARAAARHPVPVPARSFSLSGSWLASASAWLLGAAAAMGVAMLLRSMAEVGRGAPVSSTSVVNH
jgi:hypothetical protein